MGKFQLGSYHHKKLSCELISEHHRVYELSQLDWPELDDEVGKKLAAIPWRSLAQERLAAARIIDAYGGSLKANLARNALGVIALETHRQGQFLQHLATHYQLPEVGNRPQPKYLIGADYKRVTHCLNVTFFLGAGLYELVSRTGYLPIDLLTLLNTQLDEQARHLCFFVNWLVIQTQEQQKPEYEPFGVFALWYQRQQILGLLKTLNRNEYDDNLPKNPSLGDVFMGQWRFPDFIQACNQGYTQRFATFDSKLKHPAVLPQIANASQVFFGFWPERVDAPRQTSG